MVKRTVEIRQTYKYRLYSSKRDYRLFDQMNIAGIIWNHITALQKRYYTIFGKNASSGRIKKHIAKLRMKVPKYQFWQKLGSQAVQEICERHDKAYKRFFKKEGGLPRFKKVKKHKSFTLKQAGWKLEDAREGKKYRRIRINGTTYKFVYHRRLTGSIKTVTIKRDAANRIWICFSVTTEIEVEEQVSTGKIGGFDFGLRTFLAADNADKIDNPQFFKQDLPRFQKIQSRVSKKVKGSTNRHEGQLHLARRHIRIADKRQDFHYQLAHDLCDVYDILVFEDLNMEGMKRLWGRKVSDLGFSQFLSIMEWVAFKRGKRVIFINRWDRSTGKCSSPTCGHEQDIDLDERTFCCLKCGLTRDRDHNAAINIRELGHQLMLSQSEEDPSGHPALTSEAQVL